MGHYHEGAMRWGIYVGHPKIRPGAGRICLVGDLRWRPAPPASTTRGERRSSHPRNFCGNYGDAMRRGRMNLEASRGERVWD